VNFLVRKFEVHVFKGIPKDLTRQNEIDVQGLSDWYDYMYKKLQKLTHIW